MIEKKHDLEWTDEDWNKLENELIEIHRSKNYSGPQAVDDTKKYMKNEVNHSALITNEKWIERLRKQTRQEERNE